MKKLLGVLFLFASISTMAGTHVYRNTSGNVHYLGHYAIQVIYTNPVQAHQPVYSWREHRNFDGTLGIHNQNAKLIGYTDGNGVLSVVLPRLPYDPIHCGTYIGERVAVGSIHARKSAPINFTIQVPRVGPLPPWTGECRP
ncbi:hypothetical protein [Pleionea sp. CnH1-48]|uniref:hypothetical protein n=1 Tax=Pleionea sp. CnH1-48 TaxID=2954494 RepID=UPI00209731F6|nr:hypothetical protein [Pleionea sp. CnH1-48]MCO7224502.1 hypothetical protein [Pleionea sp. CnH1-48]